MAIRVGIVLLVALCSLAVRPGLAQAGEAQCRHVLIHDWYVDGRIQGQYRISCYRAAVAAVPSGDLVYRTVRKDLSQALSSGIVRVVQEGITLRPQTVIPAPQTRLATSANTKSDESHWVLSLVAVVLLMGLLVAWSVARWRSNRSTR